MSKEFFDYIIQNKIPVTVFLQCSVKLQGLLLDMDEKGFLLRRDGHTQFVYHHAISTIMPGQPVPAFEG